MYHDMSILWKASLVSQGGIPGREGGGGGMKEGTPWGTRIEKSHVIPSALAMQWYERK